jgi:hypothetical protein
MGHLFILTMYLRRKRNFWCDLGTDSPRDPALAGEIERALPFMHSEMQTSS